MDHYQHRNALESSIDQQAKDIAALGAALESKGRQTQDVRFSLLFLLEDPELNLIPQMLQMLHPGTSDVVRDDVTYRLHRVMERAVFGSEHTPPADLAALADSSPVRWMAAILRTATPRAAQNALRDRRFEFTASPEVMEQVVSAPGFGPEDVNPFELAERALEEREIELADEAAAELLGTAADERLVKGSEQLHRLFEIPQIAIPNSRFARNNLRRVCEAHPRLLFASLEEAAGAPADQRQLPLHELWEHFDESDADRLLRRASEVTTTIVTAALLPRLRPSVRVILALKKTIRQASRQPGWVKLCGELVDEWLAEFYADRNAHDRINTGSAESSELVTVEYMGDWLRVAHRVLQVPGDPFGAQVRSPHDLDCMLRELLKQLSS